MSSNRQNLNLKTTFKISLTSAEATLAFGRELGKTLPHGSIVALYGELGAGKTTLIKGLASAAAGVEPREVSSPTFTYLNIYSGQKEVYHFDLYRLRNQEEFLAMGFEEYLQLSDGVVCIEWPERIPHLLPANTLILELDYMGETKRRLTKKTV